MSAYTDFVKKFLAEHEGASFKEAAASWRSRKTGAKKGPRTTKAKARMVKADSNLAPVLVPRFGVRQRVRVGVMEGQSSITNLAGRLRRWYNSP